MCLSPGAVLLVHLFVADKPLVVDRIFVDQHERYGPSVRHRDRARFVVGVANANLDTIGRGRRRVDGDNRQPGSEDKAERAERYRVCEPAAVHATFAAARRRSTNMSANQKGRVNAATAATISHWLEPETAIAAKSPTRPARMGDGAPAPVVSIARSRRTSAAAASIATLESHACSGTHAMPLSLRRSSSSESVAAAECVSVRPFAPVACGSI